MNGALSVLRQDRVHSSGPAIICTSVLTDGGGDRIDAGDHHQGIVDEEAEAVHL